MHLELGKLYQAIGEFERASEEFRTATEIQPTNPDYFAAWGSAGLESGDLATAETNLRAAIRLQPSNGSAHRDLGILLRREGKIDEAIAELRRAEEFLPEDPTVHMMLGQALQKAGDTTQANREMVLSRQLTKTANNRLLAVSYTTAGAELLRDGQVEEATARLEQAIRLDPAYPLAAYNYGLGASGAE